VTEFERALAEYRAALMAAALTGQSENEKSLYQLHIASLGDIEARYAETGDPDQCRLLVESERIVHQSNILKGEAVVPLRAAFSRLVELVTP